jgi:hypothetical protein
MANDNIVGYAVLQGGTNTEDTRSQIDFLFKADLPKLARVEIGLDQLPWTPLVSFDVDVFNSTTSRLLFVSATVGVTTGSTVLVDIGNFYPDNAGNSETVATIDGQFCQVMAVETYGFITSLKLKLPVAVRAKIARVTISSHFVGPAVSFLYQYADACDYEQYCSSIMKVPDTASLILVEPGVLCDPGFCIDRDDVPAPRVLAGGVREGHVEGGDILDLLVTDLESIKPSEVIVTFAGLQSSSVSLQSTGQPGLIRLSIVTPPSPRAGTVKCLVTSLHRPAESAEFSFTYHESPSDSGRLTLSPSECFQNEPVVFTAVVTGWSPVAPGAKFQLNGTKLPSQVTIMSDQIVKSRWMLTKFKFSYACATPGNMSFFTSHPGTGARSTTSSILVKTKMFALTSVFPRKGPKAGGYAVLVTFTGAPLIRERRDIEKIFAISGNASVDLTCSVRSNGDGTGVIGVTLPEMAEGVQNFGVVPNTNTTTYSNATFSFEAEQHYEGVGPPLLLSAKPTSGSKFGGTIITVNVAGMAPVQDITQESSIDVVFGSKKGIVKKIRKSTTELTSVDIEAPSGFAGMTVQVIVAPAGLTTSDEASVVFTFAYVQPPADLTVQRGSTAGKTFLNATVYGFPLLDLYSNVGTIGAMFGSAVGKVTRILKSEIEISVFEVEIPSVREPGIVNVVFTALLSGQQSRAKYEFYEAPRIRTTHPRFGPLRGGFSIQVAILRFPVVYSVTQVDFSCENVTGTVKNVQYSIPEETAFELVAPSLPKPGLASCKIEPRESTSRMASVRFEYFSLGESAVVVVEEAEPIMAFTETVRHLTVRGIDPSLTLERPIVQLKNIATGFSITGNVESFLHSDEVSTKVRFRISPIPPGVYLAEFTLAYSTAFFRLEVIQSKLPAIAVAGSEGPAAGGSTMKISVNGISQSLSPEDYVVKFDGSFGVVRGVTLFKNSTVLEVSSPIYVGLVRDGSARVTVEGYSKQDPANGFGLEFVYHLFGIESAVLSTHGNSILIACNQDTKHKSGRGPCSTFLDAITVAKIGIGPTCYWSAPRHLTVTLGSASEISVGHVGTLIGFGHAVTGRGLVQEVPFTLEASEWQIVPSGRIIGPSQLSPCDSAVFTAWSSSARALEYNWRCLASSPSDTTAADLNLLLSGVHDDRVEIKAPLLRVGTTYTIEVQVTDFLSGSSSFHKSFTIDDQPIPTAYLQNPDYFSAASPFSFTVTAEPSKCMATKMELQSCPLQSHMGTVPSDLSYAWFKETVGGIRQEYEWLSGSMFKEDTPLVGKQTYAVEVFSKVHASVYALVSTSVYVMPSDLEAVVYGGDRLATASDAIELLGRDSRDPDGGTGAFLSYAWTCSLQGYPCRGPNNEILTLPDEPDVVIPPDALFAGQVYMIQFTVRSSDGRVASKIVELHTTDLKVSVVTVARRISRLDSISMLSTFNIGESVDLVAESTPSDPNLVLTASSLVQWSVVSGTPVNILDPTKFPSAFQPTLMVSSTVLEPGIDYIFNASLVDSLGWGLFRIPKENINAGPNGGLCSFEPSNGGFSLKTKFLVRCQGFQDIDELSKFFFTLKVVSKTGEEIGFPPTDLSEFEIPVLPEGNFSVVVRIMDSNGAFTSIETNTVVVVQESSTDIDARTAVNDTIRRSLDLLDEAQVINDVTRTLLTCEVVTQILERLSESKSTASEQDMQILSGRMSDLLAELTTRNELSSELAIYVLNGINTVVTNEKLLSSKSVQALSLVLDELLPSDILGKALVGPDFIEVAVGVLKKLSVRAMELASSGGLDINTAVFLEDRLQRFADVALKASLEFGDTMQSRDIKPVVLYGTRITLQSAKGATVSVPGYPDLSAKFSETLSIAGSGEFDLIDLKISYREDVLYPLGGSTGTGLELVSGTMGVTLSAAAGHNISSGVVGKVQITIPVDTSNLEAAKSEMFFSGQSVQCVFWKNLPVSPSPVDFGRWSSYGCRSLSVSRKLDASGEPISNRGLVTCQCDHLTHFAVGFGDSKVRFLQSSDTPRSGDWFHVQSGEVVAFKVDTESAAGVYTEVRLPSGSLSARGSFSQPTFLMTDKLSGVYTFEWTPRDAGDYHLQIELLGDGELVDTQVVHVRVLFCEEILLANETLQDVAIRNDMAWQALFAINPQIQNPHVFEQESQGRTWKCRNGACALSGETQGTRIKIGRVYTVPGDQTLADIVTSLGSSFTQLARHNMKRLEALMDDAPVYDIAHRHDANNTEISYVGEQFCVVSRLADGCLV